MRYRSDAWKKLAARGRFTFEAKARINGIDYVAISAPKIHRALMIEPLAVGNCISSTLTLSIMTDNGIVAKNPITILGRLTNSKGLYSEWLEFGTFFINQRDDSFDGLITVDCYDAMLKANQKYVDELTDSSYEWPKPMKSVVEEIAYRIGVAIDPRTRINTGPDYFVSYPSGKTMMQVLGYIGACHGGNWIITEENRLRLVPLITAPDETFHIISADYEKIKTSNNDVLAYQEQTHFNPVLPERTGVVPRSIITPPSIPDPVEGLINVPVVTGKLTTGTTVMVSGVKASDNSNGSYIAGDSSGFMLSIEGNPYITQNICNDLCAAYRGLVYSSYTATKALYDPAVELGDQVVIGDKAFSVIYDASIRLDLDYRADISAPNNESLSEEYPYLTEIKKLQLTTDTLASDIKHQAAALEKAVEDSGEDIGKLSESISSEVRRASGVEAGLADDIRSANAAVSSIRLEQIRQAAAIEEMKGQIQQILETLESMQSQ